jgi:branched-chain amino acid transport system substrate-binding protein
MNAGDSLARGSARVAGLLAVAALGLSACGGDDGGSGGAGGGAAGGDGGGGGSEVLIGAAWPQSGSFAFQGKASLAGAQAAVEEINEAGGIKALDGARLRLDSVDVGDAPEDATSAVNRFLTQNEGVAAVVGSWLSSLSLASSEVTERQGVPFITEAFADDATAREGFSHVFAYVPPSTEIDDLMLEATLPGITEANAEPKRVALVGDNTAAATPLQEALAEQFNQRGMEVVERQQWTPPLKNATPVAQAIANADPDVVFLIAYVFNDVSSVVRELRGRGYDGPIIQNGGQALLPEWREFAERVEGMATFVATNPLNKSEQIAETLATAVGEPYVQQDHLDGYFAIQLIAAGLEEAGDADPEALNTALHELQLSEGAAVDVMPRDVVQFGENGRIDPPSGVLAQWQEVDGELVPCTIWPTDYAVCEPQW